MSDPYAPRPDPTPAEVLRACEVLLRAGHAAEALAVVNTLAGRKGLMRRMLTASAAEVQAYWRGQRERAALEREGGRDG